MASTSTASTSASALLHTQRASLYPAKEIAPSTDLTLLLVDDPNPCPSAEQDDLTAHAQEGVQYLINALWALPKSTTKDIDAGVLALLPPLDSRSYQLPREKPLPPLIAKPKTKWEAFAQAKGIAPKPKKDRMVFDEDTQDWVPSWGYKGSNKKVEDAWIVEVPLEGKNAGVNPAEKSKADRKERVKKNLSQQAANQSRAAAASAKSVGGSKSKPSQKDALALALARTKKATASVGRFQPAGKGETATSAKDGKRKETLGAIQDVGQERDRTMKLAEASLRAGPSSKSSSKKQARENDEDEGDYASRKRKRQNDGLISEKKAVRHLTGGRGVVGMDGKKGRGGKAGRGGRGRK